MQWIQGLGLATALPTTVHGARQTFPRLTRYARRTTRLGSAQYVPYSSWSAMRATARLALRRLSCSPQNVW